MKRGSKYQLNKKTLFFIAIFSIALFIFPGETFASHLIDESISWMYREGHLYLNFISDVTTDQMEILLYNWYFLQEGNMTGRLTPSGEDFSVVQGIFYSMPIVWVNDDGSAIENEEGVTPAQLYEAWGVTLKGDGSHYIDEITYDMIQNMRVYVGESYAYAEPWVFFTETPTPPTLEATYPETGITNEVGLGSLTATGVFDKGSFDWRFLEILFSGTGLPQSFVMDILYIQSGAYNIPVNLFYADTYDVSYAFYSAPLWAYWVDPIAYKVPIATTTLIVHIGTTPEWIEFIEADYFLGEEPEEGTIQHFIWSIHKFLIGLVLPSREVRINLVNTIIKIQTLFPYNYISAVKDFIIDVREDIEQDPTLELSIFGATGTISMAFAEGNITIGSETKSLVSWIKIIISLFLWSGLLIYIISFIKRIF